MSVMWSSDLAQLATWSFFIIFGSLGHFAILGVSLAIPSLRELPLFLNLEFTVGLGCLLRSMLTWTGHGLDPKPPLVICLVNGAVTAAYLPAVGFACVGIVTKVWSHAMQVNYPNSRILPWFGYEPLLISFHWSGTLGFAIAAAVVGAEDHSRIVRGPFFCLIASRPALIVMLSLSIFIATVMMVLSVWTVVIVLRTRWRVHAAGASASVNWGLLVRTIAFLITVTIGVNISIWEIVQESGSLTLHIILALVPFASVFIFGSQKDIVALVFRRRQEFKTRHTSTIGGSRPLQRGSNGSICVLPKESRPTTARSESDPSEWEEVQLPQKVW